MSKKSYKVFLPAPSCGAIREEMKNPQALKKAQNSEPPWQIYEIPGDDSISRADTEVIEEKKTTGDVTHSRDWIMPPATLEAVGSRISELYKNVIFGDDDGEEDDDFLNSRKFEDFTTSVFDSRILGAENTQGEGSLISWPPTEPQPKASQSHVLDLTSISRNFSKFETQETQSIDHASTSSIAIFPTFTINLNSISSISFLAAALHPTRTESKKVNLLVAVMEVDGPETIRIKKGKDAGKEIGLLKLIVSDGDDEGSFSKITAWRETADVWGGVSSNASLWRTGSDNETISRGDVVHFENILASFVRPPPSSSQGRKGASSPVLSFTASPHLQSRHTICYRTMPIIASDHRYRPDLRLAATDPGVRRVAAIARWFANIAGIDDAS